MGGATAPRSQPRVDVKPRGSNSTESSAAAEDRLFDRLKLRQRTRAAGMDQSALLHRHAVEGENEDDEETDEYRDVQQCESTERQTSTR